MEINSLTNKIDVNLEIISNLINSSIQIVVSYAGQVLGATIILIIGFYLAGKLSKLIRKKLGVFDKIDPLIVPIIGNIIRYGIIIITLIAVLGQFGVQTTSIIAVLGAAIEESEIISPPLKSINTLSSNTYVMAVKPPFQPTVQLHVTSAVSMSDMKVNFVLSIQFFLLISRSFNL